jgi:hypothetical protein
MAGAERNSKEVLKVQSSPEYYLLPENPSMEFASRLCKEARLYYIQ